ncbi:MAG: Y4yA family PLP-dependent enzyme [Verrucomicrobiales bacterium]|nr:Y4yA family PLP-dependent enzyme [Verrucomicrobiales bacterium]
MEPWLLEAVAEEGSGLHAKVAEYGSPLNLIEPSVFTDNLRVFQTLGSRHLNQFSIYFARKANKALSFVSATMQEGAGLDVASHEELDQALGLGFPPGKIICTAAVKSQALIQACVDRGVVIAIDSDDELQKVEAASVDQKVEPAQVALRVGGFTVDGKKLFTRFGFEIDRVVDDVQSFGSLARWMSAGMQIRGLHFHLDGYDYLQRAAAIHQSTQVIDELRRLGHELEFVDMGGGFPVCYLEDESEWLGFLEQHRSALRGERPPITHRNHSLGYHVEGEMVYGKPKLYPFYQESAKEGWLERILREVAESLNERNLELRCEPGRALLDGAGATVARVEFVKHFEDGRNYIGLAMNRTQCRTSSEDFLLDPLLIRSRIVEEDYNELSGYLVGAYCTESELILQRKIKFPKGVKAGDLLALPNTAGYFMHFLESRSHQFPLAKNLLAGLGALDPIDLESELLSSVSINDQVSYL